MNILQLVKGAIADKHRPVDKQFPQANQDYEMERLMREQQAKLKLQSRYAQIEQERITERRV